MSTLAAAMPGVGDDVRRFTVTCIRGGVQNLVVPHWKSCYFQRVLGTVIGGYLPKSFQDS